ncbi:MAG: hypothetical protein HQ594_04665 [Candidatus Omnitrophica bacterium]|nr:hypothetical protein [Candidatus Omnitrophota bacterium]
MFLKRKHILVIVLSSLIIAVVFVSTLVGYSLYVQWKKDSFAVKYRNSVYRLTADLFRKDIVLSNMKVAFAGDEAFSGTPLVEGSLKNNSSKTVTSVLVEVSLRKADGTVIYKDWFYPLGKKPFAGSSLFPGIKQLGNVLLPGEGISFRYQLRNCSREVIDQLLAKTNFAKKPSAGDIELVYTISGASVI